MSDECDIQERHAPPQKEIGQMQVDIADLKDLIEMLTYLTFCVCTVWLTKKFKNQWEGIAVKMKDSTGFCHGQSMEEYWMWPVAPVFLILV